MSAQPRTESKHSLVPNEAAEVSRVIKLSPEGWEAFVAELDAPPRDLPRMRMLLSEPTVFSNGKR